MHISVCLLDNFAVESLSPSHVCGSKVFLEVVVLPLFGMGMCVYDVWTVGELHLRTVVLVYTPSL